MEPRQYRRSYTPIEAVCAPPPAPAPAQYGYNASSHELFEAAEAATKYEEASAANQALHDRITAELGLCAATAVLLRNVRSLVLESAATVPASSELARFRKELQPLAETYGLRIVLVGDRTTATLVK